MITKKIQFKRALDFAKDNGYLYAIYEKRGENYELVADIHSLVFDDYITEETKIIVKTIGCATDFNEFITEDGQYCFRLHNNLNIPKFIPIFDMSLFSRQLKNNYYEL